MYMCIYIYIYIYIHRTRLNLTSERRRPWCWRASPSSCTTCGATGRPPRRPSSAWAGFPQAGDVVAITIVTSFSMVTITTTITILLLLIIIIILIIIYLGAAQGPRAPCRDGPPTSRSRKIASFSLSLYLSLSLYIYNVM